jgi:hypothetical protein
LRCTSPAAGRVRVGGASVGDPVCDQVGQPVNGVAHGWPCLATGADSRGRFGGSNGAREFVQTAPIDAQDKAKLAYLNA